MSTEKITFLSFWEVSEDGKEEVKTLNVDGRLTQICVFSLMALEVCVLTRSVVCDPVDCSPLGYSVHGISQARILEGVAISSSDLPDSDPGIELASLGKSQWILYTALPRELMVL